MIEGVGDDFFARLANDVCFTIARNLGDGFRYGRIHDERSGAYHVVDDDSDVGRVYLQDKQCFPQGFECRKELRFLELLFQEPPRTSAVLRFIKYKLLEEMLAKLPCIAEGGVGEP